MSYEVISTSPTRWSHVNVSDVKEARHVHDVKMSQSVRSSGSHADVIDVTQTDAEVTGSVGVIDLILSGPDDVRYWPAPASTFQLNVVALGQRHRTVFQLVDDRPR